MKKMYEITEYDIRGEEGIYRSAESFDDLIKKMTELGGIISPDDRKGLLELCDGDEYEIFCNENVCKKRHRMMIVCYELQEKRRLAEMQGFEFGTSEAGPYIEYCHCSGLKVLTKDELLSIRNAVDKMLDEMR